MDVITAHINLVFIKIQAKERGGFQNRVAPGVGLVHLYDHVGLSVIFFYPYLIFLCLHFFLSATFCSVLLSLSCYTKILRTVGEMKLVSRRQEGFFLLPPSKDENKDPKVPGLA